ncbi:MAG: nuclear transport factor 2 family protein, partial [Mesorhizobium sp.]
PGWTCMTPKKAERRENDLLPVRRKASLLLRRALALTLGILMTTEPTSRAGSRADDAKTVAALDTEYQAAVKNNDAATMDRILADDFVLVTGLGKTYSKADLLAEARSRRMHYERQEDSKQQVRLWEDTAVITAFLWAKGTEDGKAFDYKLWFSDTYVRTPKGWRYAFAQASTRVPNEPND